MALTRYSFHFAVYIFFTWSLVKKEDLVSHVPTNLFLLLCVCVDFSNFKRKRKIHSRVSKTHTEWHSKVVPWVLIVLCVFSWVCVKCSKEEEEESACLTSSKRPWKRRKTRSFFSFFYLHGACAPTKRGRKKKLVDKTRVDTDDRRGILSSFLYFLCSSKSGKKK